MLLIASVVVLALILSSKRLRSAAPFESVLAVGSMVALTFVLFQMGKLV